MTDPSPPPTTPTGGPPHGAGDIPAERPRAATGPGALRTAPIRTDALRTAPYGQTPYGQPPYGQAPYGQAPYGQAPAGSGVYPVSQGWGYGVVPPKTEGLATTALVLSLVGLVLTVGCGIGMLLEIAALPIAHRGPPSDPSRQRCPHRRWPGPGRPHHQRRGPGTGGAVHRHHRGGQHRANRGATGEQRRRLVRATRRRRPVVEPTRGGEPPSWWNQPGPGGPRPPGFEQGCRSRPGPTRPTPPPTRRARSGGPRARWPRWCGASSRWSAAG